MPKYSRPEKSSIRYGLDEATGYQRDRARDALEKILEEFIAKELRPWVPTFPDAYYACPADGYNRDRRCNSDHLQISSGKLTPSEPVPPFR
jgi:hypothetical protein